MLTQNYYNINNEGSYITTDSGSMNYNHCSYIPIKSSYENLRLSIINPENKRIVGRGFTASDKYEVIANYASSADDYRAQNNGMFFPFSMMGTIGAYPSGSYLQTWVSTVGDEVFQITTDQITNDFPAGTACNGYNINSLLILGSGTTAPTINDYKLENCNLNYKIISNYQEYNGLTKVGTRSMTIVPQEENMTVSELGLYTMNNCQTAVKSGEDYTAVGKWYNGNAYAAFVLIARTVLDKPLILEKGKSYQISYSINFATGKDTINH